MTPPVSALLLGLLLAQGSDFNAAILDHWDFSETRAPRLKVLTFNIGQAKREDYARASDGDDVSLFHKRQLDGIAAVLRSERAHVVALQEVELPSTSGGGFDHRQYVAEKAGYDHHFAGSHFRMKVGKNVKTERGTALLSVFSLTDTKSDKHREVGQDFHGYVQASIRVPGYPKHIHFVSLHLDAFFERVRRRQLEALVERMRDFPEPYVLMGDFNCQWNVHERCLAYVVRELNLGIYGNERAMPTYGTGEEAKRYDWILLSPGLRFVHYRHVKGPSDHRAVVATIELPDVTTTAD